MDVFIKIYFFFFWTLINILIWTVTYEFNRIVCIVLEKFQSKSFLDLLLNILNTYPDEMTDKDIREEVDTFLFEGHDTTSVAMTMTLLMLGLYQDIQVNDPPFKTDISSTVYVYMEHINSFSYIQFINLFTSSIKI